MVKVNKEIFLLISLMTLQAIVPGNLAFAASNKRSEDVHREVVKLDFSLLERTEQYVNEDRSDFTEIPKEVLALNGKQVEITGHLIAGVEAFYSEEPVTHFAVSKTALGCPFCNGDTSPTIFNTVIVNMKEGRSLKPPFAPYVEVTGTFNAKKEYFVDENGIKRLDAIFYINDAQAKTKKRLLSQNIF